MQFERAALALISQASLSPSWLTKTLDTFDKMQELAAFVIADKYVENWQKCRSLGVGLFFKSICPGVGKTHLAWAVALEIMERYPHQVFSEFSGRLSEEHPISAQRWDIGWYLDSIQRSFRTYNVVVANTPYVELLILDDIGSEYSSTWGRNQIRKLINTRYENELPTLYTTTASQHTLESHLGYDVMDRIMSRNRVVEFVSRQSYRKTEGQNLIKKVGL